LALRLVGACTSLVTGALWAYGTVALFATVSGISSADNEAGARFAYAMMFLAFVLGVLIASGVAYAIARSSGWSILRSLGSVQAGLAAVCAAMLLLAFVS
jgi:membrane protein DedA with SNARE-associated domain